MTVELRIIDQEKVSVLDHGSVQTVEVWGSDERIIEAARMSTQGGFVSWEPYEGHPKGDAGLLAYLWKNNHATPFEMAGLTVEVQAPIFVFREWHRHRTQSYNEASARYAPLPALDYLPTVERCLAGGGHLTKQAGSATDKVLTEEAAKNWLEQLEYVQNEAEIVYQNGLELGIPKELARLSMTVGRYSRMRASANLRNWFAFLKLRLDPKAQREIRAYAEAVGKIIEKEFPRTWALFAA